MSNKATREGFGLALTELAADNPEVMAICADLRTSLCLDDFATRFPQQYVEVGVGEQNMAGVAAGLAMNGRTVFAASFAAFNPGRNWEQVRVSVCLQNLNVKIVGSHAGLATGEDGATHQSLEDLAITTVLPNMTVVVPADFNQAQRATRVLALEHVGPAYLRLSRLKTPTFTNLNQPFKLGRADILREGGDLTIVACGLMVERAMAAAAILAAQHQLEATVINCHTLKPLDQETLLAAAQKTPLFVTAEEHQLIGGLGSIIATFLATHHPLPIEMVGVRDTFGKSGSGEELLNRYHLNAEAIVEAALRGRARLN